MKHYLYFAALLILVGCASHTMETWLGHSESELLASWGAPDRTAKTNDGKEVLTWNGINGYGRIVCQKTFIISASGYVESFSTSCL